MRVLPSTGTRFIVLLATALALSGGPGCESTHETYQGDAAQDVISDIAPDQVGEGDLGDSIDGVQDTEGDADVALVSCDDEDGVTVSGTVTFEGEVPGSAKLWIIWMVEIGQPGFPPCFNEVTPIRFPLDFRILGVPRGETWSLVILLDVDGLFPPLPAQGDYWATVPGDQIDLSGDVSGLMLELEPYDL